MPIVQAELVKYGSVNMPEDDVSTSGGDIDLQKRLDELILAATDDLEAVSSSVSDTVPTITVTGRDATGAIQSTGAFPLNGTTPVPLGTTQFERILKVVKSADTVGTVTIRRAGGGAVVCTLPPTVRQQRRLFYDSSSEATQKIRYEKEHWRNENGSLTLTNGELTITADPQARIRAGLENADGDSVANRLAAPSGVVFVSDGVAIVVGNLAAGANVGLWLEQDLPADDPAFKSTVTTQLLGNTV